MTTKRGQRRPKRHPENPKSFKSVPREHHEALRSPNWCQKGGPGRPKRVPSFPGPRPQKGARKEEASEPQKGVKKKARGASRGCEESLKTAIDPRKKPEMAAG